MSIYIVVITIAIVVLSLYTLPPIWTRSLGKLNKDGSEVYLGDGKWDTVNYTNDGREYLNPITNTLEPIPGVISVDKTTVFNGTTWEPIILSSDGKAYLNPLTNKFAPVQLVRTDEYGRSLRWDLFDSEWL